MNYEQIIIELEKESRDLKNRIEKLRCINEEAFATVIDLNKKIRYYEEMTKVRRINASS